MSTYIYLHMSKNTETQIRYSVYNKILFIFIVTVGNANAKTICILFKCLKSDILQQKQFNIYHLLL